MERMHYTIPKLRFTNFARLVVFLDGMVSIALWVTGGHTAYLESSVTKWTLTGSTFELACIALIRMVILFHAFSKLEDYALLLLDNPYDPKITRRKTLTHIFTIILSLLTLAYCCTKGGLVLYEYLNDDAYIPMHATYNALVISSIVFSILEFLLTVLDPPFLKRLQRIRVEHKVVADDEKDGEKKKKVDIVRLSGLAKEEVPLLFIGMVGLFVASASTMVAPLFFGFVVDAAVHNTMAEVNYYVLLLFLISIAGAVAAMIRSWAFTLAGIRVVCNVRRKLFAAIIRQEVAFFDTNRTGELTNRLSSDTQVVQNAVTVNISMLVRYLVQIFGSVFIMFSQSAALTGVLLSVIPVVAVGAVIYGKFAQSIRKRFQDALGDAGTAAEENISNIRTVRSFVGENKAMDTYNAEIKKSYKHGKNLSIATGLFNGLVGTVAQGAITLVLWYGGKLVNQKSISVGELTAFMMYTLNVAMAFALLASLYGDFMQAVGASIRIFELMDRVPKVSSSGGSQPIDFTGEVGFENVFFTYPSRPDALVLKGVSLQVKPGEMVALVGPSGGGKSTIVSLIEKFYEPDEGKIHLGGHDVLQLDPSWFRRKISIVSQEPVLFACSIRENIAYGRDATDEEIQAAAKMANAHDFIMSFEEGYGCLVGERGTRLSGGQKQRVAIARALLMDPSILLLDEATSALDAESEHLVQEAIDRAMVGRTVLVIAHRLSTVRNASKVLVIKNGKVVESGTHEELISKGGVYKKLVLRQLSAADGQHAMPAGVQINASPEDVEGITEVNDYDDDYDDDDDEGGEDEKSPLVGNTN